jgi:uncharacterized protein (TIGR03435 family)
MLQALLMDRFKLAVHRATTEKEIYALMVAKGGLKVKEAAAKVDAATESPDAGAETAGAAGTIVSIGGLQTRMTRNPTGYTISNARIGTVRHTETPNVMSRWDAPSTTLAGLADLLSLVGALSADVVDMTGVKGRYSVVLDVSLKEMAAAAAVPPEARGDRAAMQATIMDMENALVRSMNDELQKIGLQLTRRKGPVETLVVDHVERPSEN